jgi:dihydroorotate dehydrogenase (NAD+) catalytic subunit
MKRDLYFSKPLMNAAGSLGFIPDPHSGISLDSFGAFVTNPVSLRPRLPTSKPDMLIFPGGFLLHTGLPNPGLTNVLKKYSAKWGRADLPIIVHLMADRPEEAKHMVEMLEGIENVMAVELGFAPQLADDIITITLEMCLGEMPLIFSLPSEQVLTLGPRLIQHGAMAISISSPRGAMIPKIPTHLNIGREEIITGRLYGPSLFPQTMEAVYSASKIGLPIIASGGIWTEKDAADSLSAGAMAVQLDASLWVPKEAGTSSK